MQIDLNLFDEIKLTGKLPKRFKLKWKINVEELHIFLIILVISNFL